MCSNWTFGGGETPKTPHYPPMPTHIETGFFRAAACSAGPACVEVNLISDFGAIIRDSKQSNSAEAQLIEFSVQQWEQFCAAVTRLNSDFEVDHTAVTSRQGGWTTVTDTTNEVALQFDHNEWSAFRTGVIAGEFTSRTTLSTA